MGINSEIGNTLGSVGINTAGIFKGGGMTSNIMFGLLIVLVVAVIAGVIFYLLFDKRRYKFSIEAYGEVNGLTTRLGHDKARIFIIPNTSIKVFFLKKNKVIVPYPTIAIDKNTFCFFIRDDYEWVNIGFSNLNQDLKNLKIKYNHVDMRYANEELKELLKQYDKQDWLKKYGPILALIAMVVIMCIGFYFIADKLVDSITASSASTQASQQLLEKVIELADQRGIPMAIDTGVRVV